MVRAATWRHKLTQEPREPGGKEASWKPFGAQVLQPRRAVTDGKARYKNWVRVFVPQECGLHTFPLFTLYSRLSSPANLLPASHSTSECFRRLRRYVLFAHMFRFRRSDFIQNLRVDKTVKYHNLIHLHKR